jgi:hypothetical protein
LSGFETSMIGVFMEILPFKSLGARLSVNIIVDETTMDDVAGN